MFVSEHPRTSHAVVLCVNKRENGRPPPFVGAALYAPIGSPRAVTQKKSDEMSRGMQTFRQADLVKALKGAAAACIDVGRVEIDKAGKIVVVAAGKTTDANPETSEDLRKLL